jgi:hypothetical protein
LFLSPARLRIVGFRYLKSSAAFGGKDSAKAASIMFSRVAKYQAMGVAINEGIESRFEVSDVMIGPI